VHYLVEKGNASLELKDKDGKSVIDIAEEYG